MSYGVLHYDAGKLQAQLNSACLNWRHIANGRMQKLVLQSG